MTHPVTAAEIDALLPGLAEDLARLAQAPSVSFTGSPRGQVPRMHDLLVELLRGTGVQEIRDLTLPESNPVITGSVPPPSADRPAVLLSAHYDVRPLGPRAIADGTVNLLVHLGALRAFGGRPPVGVKVVFEGRQEPGSVFDVFDETPPRRPEDYACDAIVVADVRNDARAGLGALTVTLPGAAEVLLFGARGEQGGTPSGTPGSDDRALSAELRGVVLAEARFLERFAAGHARRRTGSRQSVSSNSLTSCTGL